MVGSILRWWLSVVSVGALLAWSTAVSFGQCPNGGRGRVYYAVPGYAAPQPLSAYQPPAPVAQPVSSPTSGFQSVAAPSPPTSTSSGAFLAWINGVRARHWLPALAYDVGLEQHAQANNGQQAARGLGHHYMGPARRQNAGWSPIGSLAQIQAAWLASPGHLAAILDPTIRAVGCAQSGVWFTMNAR